MDCSPPGSSVHGILQARILEWVAIPFSRGSSWPGIELGSPALQADSLLSVAQGKPHSFTHFPLINDNSNFQLLRPKCLESFLTLFSPTHHIRFSSKCYWLHLQNISDSDLIWQSLHLFHHHLLPKLLIGASLTGLLGPLLPCPSSSLL